MATLGIVITLFTLPSLHYDIEYEVAGVDEEWLASHPFDDSVFEKSFSFFDAARLPQKYELIPGYKLKQYSSADGLVDVKSGKRGEFVNGNCGLTNGQYKKSIPTITVELEPIVYTLTLDTSTENGYGSLDLTNDMFDGKAYSRSSNGLFTTTFTCIESFSLPTPTAKGWDFNVSGNGWVSALNESYVNKFDGAIIHDTTLKPDWSAHNYSISYSYYETIDNGATWKNMPETFVEEISNVNLKAYDYNSEFNLSSPTLSGYTFDHWEDENGQIVNSHINKFTSPKEGEVYSLKAFFKPIVYSISIYVEVEGQEQPINNSDVKVNNLKNVTAKTTYIRSNETFSIPDVDGFGYTFLGWKQTSLNGVIFNSTINYGSFGDVKLVAELDANIYHVSYKTRNVQEQFINGFSLKSKVSSYNIRNDFELDNPLCPGYTFDHWEDEAGNNLGKTYTIQKGTKASDVTYYACFIPTKYTITLTDTTGKMNDKKVGYTVEQSIDLSLFNPSSIGYEFDKWESADGRTFTNIAVGDAISLGSFTLYARWTLLTYQINFNYFGVHNDYMDTIVKSNGDSIISSDTYNYETLYTLPTLKCPGYDFLGWRNDSTQQFEAFIPINSVGNKSFTAVFKPHVYTITLNDEHGSKKIIDYTIETQDFTLETRNSTGYTFAGWRDINGIEYSNIQRGKAPQYGDLDLNAQWTLNIYSINYAISGINIASIKDSVTMPTKTSYTYEEAYDLPMLSAPGYDFKGWKENDVIVSSIALNSTGDRTFVAVFEPHLYTITMNDVHGETKTKKYTVETGLSLASETRTSTGYTFAGWKDAFGNTFEGIEIGDYSYGDITVNAYWTTNTYSIAFNVSGINYQPVLDGLALPNKLSYTVEEALILPNYDIEGYVFNGWYEGSVKVTGISVGTTGDKVFTAKFTPLTYSITCYDDGTAINSFSYTIESSFELEPLPEGDYEFDSWIDANGNKRTTVEQGSTGDIYLTALWKGTEENPYLIYNVADLENISNRPYCSYKLMRDISLSTWTPIGTASNPFTGTFDGNNHKITFNMLNNAGGYNSFGLFAYTGSNSLIKNLTIDGNIGNIENRFACDTIGSFVAYSYGDINNCTSLVQMYVTNYVETRYVKCGGIVGDICGSHIIDSSFGNGSSGVLNVSSNTSACLVGGVSGYGTSGEIRNCSCDSSIRGVCNNVSMVGGILGSRDGDSATWICATTEEKLLGFMNATAIGCTFTDTTNVGHSIIGASSYSATSVSTAPITGRIDQAYYYACGVRKEINTSTGEVIKTTTIMAWRKWDDTQKKLVSTYLSKDYWEF